MRQYCRIRVHSTIEIISWPEALPQLTLDLETALEYELRVSARARRLSLRVEPGRGLIVTVPKRFPRREIPEFVEANRTWVLETMADIARKTPPRYRLWPPRQLLLQALDQTADIMYPTHEFDPDAGSTLACESNVGISQPEKPGQSSLAFTIRCEPADKVAVVSEIAAQLATLARQTLPSWLAEQAARTGLRYKRVSIRGQRTVWGSYSSSGTLSLNYKLLFLRRELVDYVLLHELAHTVYLDHSPRFWQRLETLEPNALELDAELKGAGIEVPPWLELAI